MIPANGYLGIKGGLPNARAMDFSAEELKTTLLNSLSTMMASVLNLNVFDESHLPHYPAESLDWGTVADNLINRFDVSAYPRLDRYDFYQTKVGGWADLGYGTTAYVDHNGKAVKPVVVRPGDWLYIEATLEDQDIYSLNQGMLVPTVIIGNGRTGTAYGGEYYDGGVSGCVKVISKNKLIARVPNGAKTGPLMVNGLKSCAQWLGKKVVCEHGKKWDAQETPVGPYNEDQIPIIVVGDYSPICEEAYQTGMSNVSEIEKMAEPYGAVASGGSSCLIGSNSLMGAPGHSKTWAKASTHWPYGFTANQCGWVQAYGKEMVFNVHIASSGGHFGGAIASIMAVLALSGIMAATGPIGVAAAGIGVTMALGMMAITAIYMSIGRGPSSGGVKVRLHRTVDDHSIAYNASQTDISAPSDGQFGHVVFSKHYKSTQQGNVKANISIDFSKARYVPKNPLHESIAWGGKVTRHGLPGLRPQWTGGEIGEAKNLNCAGDISVLKYDGTEDRKYKHYDNPGGLGDCTYNESDGYWTYPPSAGLGDGVMVEWPINQTPPMSAHIKDAVWVRASNPDPNDPTKKVGTPSLFVGMTPMSSPPKIRNISHEINIQNHMKGCGYENNNFNFTSSEGLGLGGALWFPSISTKTIGRGTILTVSTWTYDQNSLCINCDAQAIGHDARYCKRNENPLGFGGWYLGEKGEPWYLFELRQYKNRQIYGNRPEDYPTRYTGGDTSADNKLIYHPDDAENYKARFTAAYDDKTKWKAGWQHGGWPVNFLNAGGSYERQPGGQCWEEQVWQDHTKMPNHPWATTDKALIGKEATPSTSTGPGSAPLTKGHGYEYWDSAVLPTYAKPIVDDLSRMFGESYKNMKTGGKLKLTERIDLIKMVGTMSHDAYMKAEWDKVIPVGPHYEFQGGDVVVLRISPNTTKTSVPTRATPLRKLTTNFEVQTKDSTGKLEYDADGKPITKTQKWGIRGLGEFDYLGEKIPNDKDYKEFDFYTVGGKKNEKKGLASLIMGAEEGDLNWYEHIKDGYLGRLPQCLMDIHLGDSISIVNAPADKKRNTRRKFIAASLGKPIDDKLSPREDQDYIDGWNFVLKAAPDMRGTYNENVPLGFKELRRISYGRNGQECPFQARPDMDADAGGRLTEEARLRLVELMKEKDKNDELIEAWEKRLLKYWELHQYMPYGGLPGIVAPTMPDGSPNTDPNAMPTYDVGYAHNPNIGGGVWTGEDAGNSPIVEKPALSSLGFKDYESHIKDAIAKLTELWSKDSPTGREALRIQILAEQAPTQAQGGKGNGDKLEQQIAFMLPWYVASGGGFTSSDGDGKRTPTTEYIWLYFEELGRTPTQGAPHKATKLRNQEYYKYNYSSVSSTYFCVPIPINMSDTNYVRRNHRNCLSTVWDVPDATLNGAFTKCAGG